MTAGLRYHLGDWAPYAAFSSGKTTTGTTESGKFTKWGAGLGRNSKMGDVKFSYSVAYFNETEAKSANVPFNMNLEGDATSWLTVRAGLGYTAFERPLSTGATTARFGGTFHLGKADLDMVVGGGSAAGSIDSSAFDAANGFFSQASLTFRM
jgi:hypothetical protein